MSNALKKSKVVSSNAGRARENDTGNGGENLKEIAEKKERKMRNKKMKSRIEELLEKRLNFRDLLIFISTGFFIYSIMLDDAFAKSKLTENEVGCRKLGAEELIPKVIHIILCIECGVNEKEEGPIIHYLNDFVQEGVSKCFEDMTALDNNGSVD